MSVTQCTTKHADDELVESYQRVPMLIIMTHSNRERIGEQAALLDLHLSGTDYLSRIKPDFAKNGNAGRALLDEYVSRSPIIFESANNGGIKLRAHSTKTVLTVAGQPPQDDYLVTESELDNGVVLGLNHRVVLLLKRLPLKDTTVDNNHALMGVSADIQAIRQRVEYLAELEVPVVIRGAIGVGKKQAAYAIHKQRQHDNKPFISVNLAAIHDAVAETELFGVIRSGKHQPGYFEQAGAGTIVLEDIEDASDITLKLLSSALQSKSVVPKGGMQAVPIQCRIVITSRQESSAVDKSSKVSMLFEKLAPYQLFIPPLIQRKEDIGLLFNAFICEQWRKLYPETADQFAIPGELMKQLMAFDWPGNVRQLRNVARQVVIDSRDQEQLYLDPQLLSLLKPQVNQREPERATPKQRKPNSVSRNELTQALENCQFELQAVAKKLNISRASVYQLIQRFDGLYTAQDLSESEIKDCYAENRGDTEKMMWALRVSKIGLRRRLKSLGYDI